MSVAGAKPLRLLVVMPSWMGDCVMATPALKMLRQGLPGCFIGVLVRPGNDELLAGLPFFDEVHIERASGVMGPKFAAAKVRPRRYGTALLLTNSFSTALTVRIAGIPDRVGFDRDARGLLLTRRLKAPVRDDGRWAPVSAVVYYEHAAACVLDAERGRGLEAGSGPSGRAMELRVTREQAEAAAAVLMRGGVKEGERLAILNPGGNNAAKRWPPARFATIARRLAEAYGLRVVLNGSPAESGLVGEIAAAAACGCVELPKCGITVGALKAIVSTAAIMVTNDTGPRHIAAALGVPVISLFGPTDHRWTTIPAPAGEALIVADPSLPEIEFANDHPERCAIENVDEARVWSAVEAMLGLGG